MTKNPRQPDSDIIPAQQVIVQNKRILSELSDVISILRRMEEKEKSQGYDSQPVKASWLKEIFNFLTPLVIYKAATILLLISSLSIGWAYYYDHNLTEDSWARRAYDAAVKLNDPKPGIQYIRVRLLFNEGKKKSAQAHTLDLEAQVEMAKEEEAKAK